jgi:uncharacterized membrane protein YdjX (TVP38/TMEM64 family)
MLLKRSQSARKLGVLAVSAAFLVFFWYAAGYEEFAFSYLRDIWANVRAFHTAHPFWSSLLYIAVYVAAVSLFLPVAAVLKIMGGALFGLMPALVIVSAANVAASTFGMLLARHFFYDKVQRLYAHELAGIDRAMRREGGFYIVLLRLTPVIPSAVVNLIMGVLPVRVGVYAVATFIGAFPLVAFYAWMGTSISEITSLSGLITPQMMLASVALVGLLALGKWALSRRHGR